VNNIDFLPTLLDAAGVPYPAGKVQGRSFWPRLAGGAWTAPEAIYTEREWHENYDPVRTVRTERYHYLRNLLPGAKKFMLPQEILASANPKVRASWPNKYIFESDLTQPGHQRLAMFETRPAEELYDLHNDPEEFINLADDPAHQETKKKLSAMCDAWMAETGDPGLEGLQPVPALQLRNLARHMNQPNLLMESS
jgi:arylsulfatase A-like enzyme